MSGLRDFLSKYGPGSNNGLPPNKRVKLAGKTRHAILAR